MMISIIVYIIRIDHTQTNTSKKAETPRIIATHTSFLLRNKEEEAMSLLGNHLEQISLSANAISDLP